MKSTFQIGFDFAALKTNFVVGGSIFAISVLNLLTGLFELPQLIAISAFVAGAILTARGKPK